MNFVFVSECEKKAHARTRKVLDAFAIRIGSYTWIASLTTEGIDALHSALKKTASRSSAISCHKIGRSEYQLMWIVGNRNKFNLDGAVPINYTELDDLPLIEAGQ